MSNRVPQVYLGSNPSLLVGMIMRPTPTLFLGTVSMVVRVLDRRKRPGSRENRAVVYNLVSVPIGASVAWQRKPTGRATQRRCSGH